MKEALVLRTATLEKIPTDELSWIARGTEQLPGRPEAAIADFQSALKINPDSLAALQNIAAVQSEYLGQNGLAIESLTRLIQSHPQYVPAFASRGILLARKGSDQEALADARLALKLDRSVPVCYQVAGIYATTSRITPSNADEAYQLLAEAFRSDRKWIDISLTDPDLKNLRTDSRYKQLIDASRLLHNPR
jgi:tetratricopeptide (TPR) repeat protein